MASCLLNLNLSKQDVSNRQIPSPLIQLSRFWDDRMLDRLNEVGYVVQSRAMLLDRNVSGHVSLME